MKTFTVTFEVEMDFGSMGMPQDQIAIYVRALASGFVVDPKVLVSNARERSGVIFFDSEMTIDAANEQDAIDEARAYITGEASNSEILKIMQLKNFKAIEKF